MLYSDGVILNDNIIADNIADNTNYPLCWSSFSVGGGLLVDFNSDAILVNNLITDNQLNNQVNSQGSGLYVRASSLRLLHTTIARNSGGDSSGVYVTEMVSGPGLISRSMVVLTNTIIVSQTVGVTVTAGNTATLNSTLWNGNTINWGGAGPVNTSNDYTGNPAFLNPNAGNYHIDPTSAALDKGINAGITTDIDGQPRPQGGGYDLGADEYPDSPTPFLIINKNGPSTATAGSRITYTLTITNSGLAAATNLVITDVIPTGATYVSGGTKVGNVVSWMIPSLAANGGITQTTFIVTATQTITNSDYRVQADGGYKTQGTSAVVTEVSAETPEQKIFLPVILKE